MFQPRNEILGRFHRCFVDVVVGPGVDTAKLWQCNDLCVLDVFRDVIPSFRHDGTREHERWHADGGEDVANVQFHRRAKCGYCGAGTETPPHVPYEPPTKGVVPCDFGGPFPGEILQEPSFSPVAANGGEAVTPLFVRRCPRIVRRLRSLCSRVEEDKPQTAGVHMTRTHRAGGRGVAAPM